MDAKKVLSLIKSIHPFTGKDVRVTLDELLNLTKIISMDEIVAAVMAIPGVNIIDNKLGGISIPAKYFTLEPLVG